MKHFLIFLFLLFSLKFEGSTKLAASLLNSSPQKTHYVSICAIFQDEAPWLKEWIEFHQMIGVSHFFLYNNKSTDNYKEVLKPYVDKGIVKLINWPGSSGNFNETQCAAYMNCIKKNKGKTKWIAFIDIDEFICPVIDDYLPTFLKRYENYPGVTANWVQFGTSFIEKIPQDKLLIEILYLSAGPDLHVKSIVQPEYVVGNKNPHSFKYKAGSFAVNADYTPVQGALCSALAVDKIRINHYHTRDEYYLRNFKLPRRLAWKSDWLANRHNVDLLSQVPDTVIFKFVPQLRASMDFY